MPVLCLYTSLLFPTVVERTSTNQPISQFFNPFVDVMNRHLDKLPYCELLHATNCLSTNIPAAHAKQHALKERHFVAATQHRLLTYLANTCRQLKPTHSQECLLRPSPQENPIAMRQAGTRYEKCQGRGVKSSAGTKRTRNERTRNSRESGGRAQEKAAKRTRQSREPRIKGDTDRKYEETTKKRRDK